MPARSPQAAAIPYRLRPDGGLEVLLVTSSSGRWMAPKGWIEPGRTAAEAATLEALEEAGAIGRIVEPELGRFTDINADGAPREVRVFALAVDRVLDHWQEESTRRRRWMTVEEATEAVCKHGLAGLLEKLSERLKP